MAERVLYRGGVLVASPDYRHHAHVGGRYAEIEIEGLDEVVARAPLTFTIDYPFDELYEGTIDGADELTLRQIIDAVRAGYRSIYEAAVVKEHPKLANSMVTGRYGRAFHDIEDLVIERISLDEKRRHISLWIGS